MHSSDARMAKHFKTLKSGRSTFPAFAGIRARAGASLATLDPETAALHYLEQAIAEPSIPQLTSPVVGDSESEFKSLGTETVALTGTKTVKFRQTLNKIPVYGSLVTVELDDRNDCLAINSSIGTPKGVDPVARVAPAAAVKKASALVGVPVREIRSTPRIHYYYDANARRWRLVYILEDLPVRERRGPKAGRTTVRRKDLIFDANTGALVRELPRTPTTTATSCSGVDGLGRSRTFGCARESGGTLTMSSVKLNVHTFDFRFKDPDTQESRLPGPYVARPPIPWPPAAVSAHANAEKMSRFLRAVLKRDNIDNQGGPMRSSINCVVQGEESRPREWLNAYWNGNQMVYGQRRTGSTFRSLAEVMDIVAHEMFHGVTDFTARLEYANESGALNESYSDIFGCIVANYDRADVTKWNWEIGEGLDAGGKAFRDMRDPRRHDQPAHMRDYEHLPNTENGDWGGVHTNSGIHNYAAYRILSARGKDGKRLLRAGEVAAIFYIAITQYLSRNSGFSDSRRGVVLAARTLYRSDSASVRDRRVSAIEAGFSAAGIR
jgi:Zn-dependent metalloprotease